MKEQNRLRLERLTARFAKRVAEKTEAREEEFARAFEEVRERVLAPIMEEFAASLRGAGHDARVLPDSGPHAPSIELSLGLMGGRASRNVVGFAVIRWKGYPLQVLGYLEANPPPFDLVRYAHPSEIQADAVEQLLIDAIEHFDLVQRSVRLLDGTAREAALGYTSPRRHFMKRMFLILAGALALAGCGDDVGSEEDAERAYVGIDKSVDKAMQLGFAGFNAASSADIPPQTGNGDKGGTLVIDGKVDQGSSDNKTMNLTEKMTDYTDDDAIVYNTLGALPLLDLKLSKIPDGTITGTLTGEFTMTGELEGPVTLSLSITGDLQPTAADATKIERKPDTTKIIGTATSDYGTYNVNVTR